MIVIPLGYTPEGEIEDALKPTWRRVEEEVD